jgi:hypothetical protein
MHYKRAETIGTAAQPRSFDPMSVAQGLRGGPADVRDVEAFWQAISLQAAARAAAFAKGSEAPQGRGPARFGGRRFSSSLIQISSGVGYWHRRLRLRYVLYAWPEPAAGAVIIAAAHVDRLTIAQPVLESATLTVAGSDARERRRRAPSSFRQLGQIVTPSGFARETIGSTLCYLHLVADIVA